MDPNLVKEFQQDNQKKTVQELEEGKFTNEYIVLKNHLSCIVYTAAVSSDDGHGGENGKVI